MDLDWETAWTLEPVIRKMAHRRLHRSRTFRDGSIPLAEVDDLVSAGLFAVAEAAPRYDPARGVKLLSFLEYRIQGAFSDYLRDIDPLVRAGRGLLRELQAAEESGDSRAVRRLRKEVDQKVAVRVLLSLDGPAPRASRTGKGRQTVADVLPDTKAAELDERLLADEAAEIVMAGLARLPERMRFVLTLYYFEDVTLRNIAAIMGVTESRVSQIKTAAEHRLRHHFLWASRPAA